MTPRELAEKGYAVHAMWIPGGRVSIVVCNASNTRAIVTEAGHQVAGWSEAGDMGEAVRQASSMLPGSREAR